MYIANSSLSLSIIFFFFFNDTATTEIYTLSLHDALPILVQTGDGYAAHIAGAIGVSTDAQASRSEEHTSELQSPYDLVCRLLLEKKKNEQRTWRSSLRRSSSF